MAKQSYNLKGATGKVYQFNSYKWPTRFTNDIGVVYVFSQLVKGFHYPIYIGMTSELSRRIDEHAADNECLKTHEPTHVGILAKSKESDRKFIEKDLLEMYPTPCNKQNN